MCILSARAINFQANIRDFYIQEGLKGSVETIVISVVIPVLILIQNYTFFGVQTAQNKVLG